MSKFEVKYVMDDIQIVEGDKVIAEVFWDPYANLLAAAPEMYELLVEYISAPNFKGGSQRIRQLLSRINPETVKP